MAQITDSKKTSSKIDDNEWLENFLNASDNDLITMAQKGQNGNQTEFSVLQVENILDMKKRANFLYQGNRHKEALTILEDAIKLLPGDIELNFFQAQCLYHLGEIDRVEIIVGNLLHSDDKQKIIQLPRMYAFSLLRKKKFSKAEKFLEKNIPLYGFDIQLRNMYGFSLEQQDKLNDAEIVFSDILTQEPENANANNSLAYIYYRYKKNYQHALTLAEKALYYEPENPAFLDTCAMIKFALGDATGARENLQTALRIAPGNTTILEHLGKVLEA
ncbi:MAG: hypothetical protein OEV66_08070 [Spirochaetia bacterium]|nr:hypothetical protein [Spirochaetia bacterium]